MYFLIISYGIYAFIFSKMFIFFPSECRLLLNISMDTLIESISMFNIGVTMGKFLSIFEYNYKKLTLVALSLVSAINICFLFSFTDGWLFLFLRFLLGLCLGLIMTLYFKFIDKKGENTEQYTRVLFNYNLLALPLWWCFKIFLPMKYWLSSIWFLIMSNILYIYFFMTSDKEKTSPLKKNFMITIPYNVVKKYAPIYIFLAFITSVILFTATLVLVSHHDILTLYSEDLFYKFLQKFLPTQVGTFYDQLPFLIGALCFTWPDKKKNYLLYILIISLGFNYYFLQSITIMSINHGFIYGLYILYAPSFAIFLKKITCGQLHQASLIFYGMKSLLGFFLQYFFLKKYYKFIIKSPYHYYTIILILLFLISTFLYGFQERLEKNIYKKKE